MTQAVLFAYYNKKKIKIIETWLTVDYSIWRKMNMLKIVVETLFTHTHQH